MNSNTQRKNPMFAEVTVGRKETKREDAPGRGKDRFTYLKLTYPSGVTMTLPTDTDMETLAGYLRIKV